MKRRKSAGRDSMLDRLLFGKFHNCDTASEDRMQLTNQAQGKITWCSRGKFMAPNVRGNRYFQLHGKSLNKYFPWSLFHNNSILSKVLVHILKLRRSFLLLQNAHKRGKLAKFEMHSFPLTHSLITARNV